MVPLFDVTTFLNNKTTMAISSPDLNITLLDNIFFKQIQEKKMRKTKYNIDSGNMKSKTNNIDIRIPTLFLCVPVTKRLHVNNTTMLCVDT